MKLAIMQPYFFPYAGYFNLIAQVDKFVFYDDVNFIKNGWINRNRLFLSGDVRYFTIPLSGASPNLKINQVYLQPRAIWQRKLLESIRQSYSKAPNFRPTIDLLNEVVSTEAITIAEMASFSIRKCVERLGLTTDFVLSSGGYGNDSLTSVERVIDICERESASSYINLPGGRSLYDEDAFAQRGIMLKFSSASLSQYKQFEREFCPGLSILDMMMFNSFDECKRLLIM